MKGQKKSQKGKKQERASVAIMERLRNRRESKSSCHGKIKKHERPRVAVMEKIKKQERPKETGESGCP